ncbi:LysE family translocator [Fusibacter ferrireducens]|uniref:LysE family transporter n=1 Tax=Fusibacter ferrireducens TaxID=2785058 RepID=A0ABR9ZWX5_9FIRM|nr:LysE family transporter [Fusibacter ferrireducens]MBF4694653.1 LysE family transporter [Fusibacter ferrireducens]
MNFLSFMVYCIIVTFTPGPSNIMILSTVHNYGKNRAIEFVIGASIGFSIMIGISAVLNTFLVAVVPKIIGIMQIIGSLYMLYLAYKIYHMDVKSAENSKVVSVKFGFIMQLINPKVILFTMTVIPSFVLPYYNAWPQILGFALLISAIGCAAFLSWVAFGMLIQKHLEKHRKLANTLMSLFLVYSAIMVSGILS